MAGHVFITQGDLTKIHCDAWLLPTDEMWTVERGWREQLPEDLQARLVQLRHGGATAPEGWGNNGVRVLSFTDEPDSPPRPQPYPVNVGSYRGQDASWFMDGARQFFAAVATQQLAPGRVTKRPKPLVGVPHIGTGHGGAKDIKGDIVRVLIATLYDAAVEHDVDIALVLNNDAAFAAAQNARWQHLSKKCRAGWPELSDQLAGKAKALADYAAGDHLVLFLGAGVSSGAGLPNWKQLLDALAVDAGMDECERKALKELHDLDKARIIEGRLAMKGIPLGQAVSARFQAKHHSLAHSLLASLPVKEAVTTNYDDLFEKASAAAKRPAAILPYHPVDTPTRWLLKMHGCVNHHEDIVLTREDYLRYADRREALAGIVQALLITRHMVFIGFSLTDDNFHQIVDNVRKAIRGVDSPRKATPGKEQTPTDPKPFGTALLLRKVALQEELWRHDLNVVAITDREDGEADLGAARLLDIFLDCVLAEARRGTSHILDKAYDGILTDDERELRDLLQALIKGATDKNIRASPAWRPIADLLSRLDDGAPSSSAD